MIVLSIIPVIIMPNNIIVKRPDKVVVQYTNVQRWTQGVAPGPTLISNNFLIHYIYIYIWETYQIRTLTYYEKWELWITTIGCKIELKESHAPESLKFFPPSSTGLPKPHGRERGIVRSINDWLRKISRFIVLFKCGTTSLGIVSSQ